MQSCDIAHRGRRWIVTSLQPLETSNILEEDLEPGRLSTFILKFPRGMEERFRGDIDVRMCGCDFGKKFELKDVMLGK